MALDAFNWAKKQKIKPGPKVLLMLLADWMRENGSTFPSQATLCKPENCFCSLRTLQKDIKYLERKGLVARVKRHGHNGAQISDEYKVLAPGYDLFPAEGEERRPGRPKKT